MYLVYHGYSTQAKNQLEKDFCDYLESIDRMLIADKELEDFKKKILKKYDEFSAINKRCKPVEKSFYCIKGEDQDESLYGSNANFNILKTK